MHGRKNIIRTACPGRCLPFSHDVGFGIGTTEWAANWKKRYTLKNAFIIVEFKKGIR
jgi:hypothetical protein